MGLITQPTVSQHKTMVSKRSHGPMPPVSTH